MCYVDRMHQRAPGAPVGRLDVRVNICEIAELARAAGAAGRTWADWTANDDEASDYICAHDDHDAAVAEWQAAFDAGASAHRVAQGWVTRWTTASADYDGFGTTSEPSGAWCGKPLRKAMIRPHYVGWHEARYSSGLDGCWTVDPRVELAEHEEQTARWRANDARLTAAREGGLAWIEALSDTALEALEYEDAEAHGIAASDVGTERKRRASARTEAERVDTWDRCRAAVRDGMILVDDGVPPSSSRYGNLPGRDSHVYYDVRLSNDYEKIADRAHVVAASGEIAGSLELVAEWLVSGRLRAVSAEDVPPAPVTDRIGHERYSEIVRVVVGAKRTVVWVGYKHGWTWTEAFVLNERGHKVRSKALREEALAAARHACEMQ